MPEYLDLAPDGNDLVEARDAFTLALHESFLFCAQHIPWIVVVFELIKRHVRVLGERTVVEQLGQSVGPIEPIPETVDQNHVALSDLECHLDCGPDEFEVEVDTDAKQLLLLE